MKDAKKIEAQSTTPVVDPAWLRLKTHWPTCESATPHVFKFLTFLHNGRLVSVAAFVEKGKNALPHWEWQAINYAPGSSARSNTGFEPMGDNAHVRKDSGFDNFIGDVLRFYDEFDSFGWELPPKDEWPKLKLADDTISAFNPYVVFDPPNGLPENRRGEYSAVAFIQCVAMFPRSAIWEDGDEVNISGITDCVGNSLDETTWKVIGTLEKIDFYTETERFKDFVLFVAAKRPNAAKEAVTFLGRFDGLINAVETSGIEHPERIADAYDATIKALGDFYNALRVAEIASATQAAPQGATTNGKGNKANRENGSKGGKAKGAKFAKKFAKEYKRAFIRVKSLIEQGKNRNAAYKEVCEKWHKNSDKKNAAGYYCDFSPLIINGKKVKPDTLGRYYRAAEKKGEI